MKKILLFTIAVAVVASTIWAVRSGEAAPVSAMGDSCRNVNFRVTNGKNVAIDIKKVKYYNKSEARWVTEDVKSKSTHCAAGAVCNIEKEDLANAENDSLTQIIFVYQDDGSNVEHESQSFLPTDPACRAEKTYGYGQVWTITPSTSTTTDGSGACDVFFQYTNGKQGTVRVTAVKYYTGGKWKTENMAKQNNECPAGQSCKTYDETLTDNPDSVLIPFVGGVRVVEENAGTTSGRKSQLVGVDGADITKVKFLYQFLSSAKGSNWSDKLESQAFIPESPKCIDNKTYGLGQAWTIK